MNKFIFDLQRFSNLGTLKTLGGIIKTLGLVKLAKDLDNAKDASKWLKENANPILRFIGSTPFGKKFSSYATLITSTISIVDNALSVLTDKNLPVATRNSKIGAISGSLVTMANATNKLNKSLKKKNLWFLSILSSGISLTANLIAASDGVTLEEKKKINNGYVTLLKSLGSDLVKEIFDSAVEKQLSRAFTEDLTTDLVEEIMTKNKFFQTASKTLTKTFGVVLSLATGALNSIDEYNERMEKYNTDGIPEDIAKHDAFIDAFATFVHDNLSAYFKGVDDWVFEFMLGVAGGETNKNYIEVIADRFKTFNYKNTGSIDNDPILLSASDKSYIYGDSGNDSIKNVASDVSIWGGHDNDTIWSLKTDTITPARNSILGGLGDDFIYVQDKNSTIYGGAGNDSLITDETKNLLYGGSGDDYIFLVEDANSNTVSGDLGNDLILIDSAAKKNKFRYSTGDGNDTISGFNANDSLIIDGKYSTTKSGSDIKVKIGTGSILLLGAADKKIYINGNVYNGTPDTSGTFTPIEIPYLSAPKSPLINGTSGNDTIENSRSNVLINAGKGDDSIVNYYSDSVSIKAGDGNDSIDNSGNSVTIYGGEGNDQIENDGANVTINAGTGDDSIYNSWGESVTINAGTGDDSIYNSWGESVTINAGAGDDSIHNYRGGSVTIDAGAGNDSIYNDWADFVTINGDDGNDYISISAKNVLISGEAGNDTIWNQSYSEWNAETNSYEQIVSNVTILGGAGNDSIINRGGDNVTINGGAGDDTVESGGDNVSINGGAGNDSIDHYAGANGSINAGTGNDIVSLSPYSYYVKNTLIQYTSGDGNDTIFNFNENDTLQIGGGTGSYFSKTSGNDVIVTVGTGKITLVGAASLSTVNIAGVWKDPAFLTVTNSTKSPVTIDSVVKTVDASKRTSAIKITGNKLANSISGGTKRQNLWRRW